MIRHASFMEFTVISSHCGRSQRLNYRKIRHVTSHYMYSSHGIVYVLLLLIYCCHLIHLPTMTMAETTSAQKRIVNVSQTQPKTNPDSNQLMKLNVDDEGEDEEYFSADEEDDRVDKEYKDLISNKSAIGMYIGAPCDGPKIVCSSNKDMSTLTSDLPTLLGVSTGIAVLAGLICMVLHLFSKTKYPRHRNFTNSSSAPPILYSSDTVHSARPSSRSSIQSNNSISSYTRRPSSAPHTNSSSKGVLVSTSRSGSRRPSLASVYSTSSSIRSYSAMRFEKELQQKELRQEMKLRLTRLQQQQHLIQNKPHIIISDPNVIIGAIPKPALKTPSPLTPNSLDELLPCVIETAEPPTPIKLHSFRAYSGPCSSAFIDDLLQ